MLVLGGQLCTCTGHCTVYTIQTVLLFVQWYSVQTMNSVSSVSLPYTVNSQFIQWLVYLYRVQCTL